jgi:hypothetical protein
MKQMKMMIIPLKNRSASLLLLAFSSDVVFCPIRPVCSDMKALWVYLGGPRGLHHPIVKEAVDLGCLFVCNKCGLSPPTVWGEQSKPVDKNFAPKGQTV